MRTHSSTCPSCAQRKGRKPWRNLESEPRINSYGKVACGILAKPGTSLVLICFSGLFSWHPFLALSLFMTEAMTPLLSTLLSHPEVSPPRHMSSGSCSVSVPPWYLNRKPHFTLWHGLVGLEMVCVVGVQTLAALPLLYYSLAKGWSLARLKRYAASGLITYQLGSASLLLGTCSVWFTGAVGRYTCQVSNTYMAKKRMVS
uniref:Cytochrome b561 domain-containing protein n=1 Tax=Salmo trutta TaxID=8032 RepID=A0A673ZDL1_SALTR